jgi:hypothetical protein
MLNNLSLCLSYATLFADIIKMVFVSDTYDAKPLNTHTEQQVNYFKHQLQLWQLLSSILYNKYFCLYVFQSFLSFCCSCAVSFSPKIYKNIDKYKSVFFQIMYSLFQSSCINLSLCLSVSLSTQGLYVSPRLFLSCYTIFIPNVFLFTSK